jgi:hypothetical protein
VPKFKELGALVALDDAEAAPSDGDELPPPSRFTRRRKVALAVGAVGLVSIGVGVVLGVQAQGLEDDAFALCPDPEVPCPDGDAANRKLDKGHTRAVLSNVGYGVGAAAIVGAAILWFTGAPRADHRVAVSPRLGDAGLDVLVRF